MSAAPNPGSDVLVALSGASFGHGRQIVVDRLEGQLQGGQSIAVTGCNGSGKSTLLRGLAGLSRPLAGSIVRHGITRQQIGFLPQVTQVNRSVPITVQDYAASALFGAIGPWSAVRETHWDQVAAALDMVGLRSCRRALISTISGGQFQRLSFARIMLQDPRLILLDEPFAALDTGIIEQLMDVISGWVANGRCVVAALHHGHVIPRFMRQLDLDGARPVWVGEAVAGQTARLRVVPGNAA